MKKIILALALVSAARDARATPLDLELRSAARHERKNGIALLVTASALSVAATIAAGLWVRTTDKEVLCNWDGRHAGCDSGIGISGGIALSLAVSSLGTLVGGVTELARGNRHLRQLDAPTLQVVTDRGHTDGGVLVLGGRF